MNKKKLKRLLKWNKPKAFECCCYQKDAAKLQQWCVLQYYEIS